MPSQFRRDLLDFGRLQQQLVVAVPLHEVGSSHERAVFRGASVVVPQIKIEKLYGFVERFGGQQPLVSERGHQRLDFDDFDVCIFDNPLRLSIEPLHLRLRVALQTGFFHGGLTLMVGRTFARDRREQPIGEAFRGVVRHVQAVQTAQVTGGAGRHGHIRGREAFRVGGEIHLAFLRVEEDTVLRFVENLDLVFKQIADERAMYALRGVLSTNPEIMVVGTANAMFEEIRSYDAAFYEFFQVVMLTGLDTRWCTTILENTLARKNGSSTREQASLEQGRIETIRTLTGGNPRLITLASEIIAQSPLGTAFEDLESLVDQQTPFYKASIEALPVQARKIFDYLATQWRPLRAREVSDGVNLTPSHTSAQLRQLIQKGYVRDVQLPDETRSRYEVVDRL